MRSDWRTRIRQGVRKKHAASMRHARLSPPAYRSGVALEPLERRLMLSADVQLNAPSTNYSTTWSNSGPVSITGVKHSPVLVSGVNVPFGIAASDGNLFVTSGIGPLGEYNATTGATVNASLVPGLSAPFGVAVSGANLFVANESTGRVGEYNATTGAAVNASLVSGLNQPYAVAVSGANLYVVNNAIGTVGEYNANTGATINSVLVAGLAGPTGVAVSGADLFVVNLSNNTIGKYNATTGVTENASFVSGLNGPFGIAVSGGNLFVTNSSSGTIGEYNATTGAAVNASLVTGLKAPVGIAVSGADLFVVDDINNTVGEYNATTGAPAVNSASINDDQGDTLTSLSITLASPRAGDVLTATGGNGVTVTPYNAATGTLLLSGTASLFAYQAALASVQYDNTSGGPGVGSETVNVVANDGASNSSAAVGTITINGGIITNNLVVTAQPNSPVTVGAPFNVTVTSEDGQGHVQTGFNGSVTISLANNPSGASLSGTLTATAVNGVATFKNLAISARGSGYTLQVTSAGLTSATTSAFDVNDQVVTFVNTNVVAGQSFGFTVDAEKNSGALDTSFNGSVTVALANNPGGASLGGTVTVTAINGVASFNDLTISAGGTGYTLQVTGTGLTTATSSAFNVENILLIKKQPPTTVTAGDTFSASVEDVDGLGNVQTGFTGTVTVTGTGLQGSPVTATAVNGVATFNNLVLTSAGLFNQLYFSATNQQSVNSSDITVKAGPADHLTVSSLFGTQAAGSPLYVGVDVLDAFNNLATTYNGSVTIALANNPTGAQLGGSLTVNAVNGVATFSTLTVSAGGTGYTLQATSSGLTSATGSPFNVENILVVTEQPPSTVVAGDTFNVKVADEDGLGNVQSGYSGPITVTGYGLAGSPVTVNAVDGVATFSNLVLNTAYPYGLSLQFSATGLQLVTSNEIVVNPPATPTQLAFYYQLGTQVAGSPIAVSVKAEDSLNNVVTDFTGSVTIALANNPTGAALGGSLTVSAVNGVANFNDLTISAGGTGYTLQVTSGGLTSATSDPFDVENNLVVTEQPPSTLTAGDNFTVKVADEDGLGNVQTGFNGTVTVSGYGLAGSPLTVNAVNGVATFSNLTLTATSVLSSSLFFSATGLQSVYSNDVTVMSGKPDHLVAPSSFIGSLAAGAPFLVGVDVDDAYGNLATSFNGSVTIALANNPSSALLGGTLTVTAVNGIATFNNLTVSAGGAGYALQATSDGLTSATGSPFNVENNLVVTLQPPSTVTAGSTFTVKVADEDGLGNVQSDFNGAVTVSGYGLAGSSVTVNAIDGVATFSNLALDIADPYGVSLQFSATGLEPVSSNYVVVNPAPVPTQLVFNAIFGTQVAGSPFVVTVDAEDALNNVATSFNGSVTIALANNPASAVLGGTLTVEAVNGVATFNDLTISAGGNGYRFQATSNNLSSATSDPFNVDNNLIVTMQPPSTVMAGDSFTVKVEDVDGLGNVQTGYTGLVTVAGFGLSGDALTVNAVNGVATFSNLILTSTSGLSNSLYFSATGLQSVSSNDITVTPGKPDHLAAPSSFIGTLAAGAPFLVGVDVDDAYGNVATSFNGSVTIALANNPTSALLGGTLTVTAVNGVATFNNLTVSAGGTGYTLQATSSGLTSATSSTFNVNDNLLVTGLPTGPLVAGSTFDVTIEAVDANNVVDTSFNGSVTIAFFDNPTSALLGGNLTVNFVNGVAVFNDLTINEIGVGYTFMITGTNVISIDTGPITINNNISITEFPPIGGIVAGGTFGMTIEAVNVNNVIDTSFNGSVTIALLNNPTGALLGGNLTVNFVNGIAVFNDLTINEIGVGYTFVFTGTNVLSVNTGPITINNNISIPEFPLGPIVAGGTFGMTIEAVNANNVIDTSFNGSVTIALANNPTGALLGGDLTVNFVNGIAVFNDLTINEIGVGYTFVFTGTNVFSVNTGPITINNNISITEFPITPVVAGGAFGVTIEAVNANNVIDTSFNGSVTIALANNPTGALLGGNLTVNFVNGIAVFNDLTINEIGTGYTFVFAGANVFSINTGPITINNNISITEFPITPVVAGGAFGVTIEAVNANNVVDTSFNGSVTIALLNNPTGALLGGNLTVNFVNGIAVFNDLTINEAGTGYTFAFAGTNLFSLNTGPITINNNISITEFPGTVVAGGRFGMTIEAVNANNVIDTSFNGSVTIALANNPTGALLGGTLTVNFVNGIAVFNDLTINEIGAGYTFVLTGTNLFSLNTGPITINNNISITEFPTTPVIAGGTFGVTIEALNINNVVDTSFNGSVTIALLNNPTGALLGGNLTVNFVNGIAVFNDLTINEAGVGYTFVLTENNVFSINTGPITINNNISITEFPLAPIIAGGAFGMTIEAVNINNVIDTSFNGSVTIALANNPTGALLGGNLTVNFINGIAVFNALTINEVGVGYTFALTGTNLFSLDTGPITIVDQLSIVTEPPATVAIGDIFTVVVDVEDFGAVIDTSYNGSVTIALANNPGGATLGGLLTVTAVNGVATFSGLSLDKPGLGYTLRTSIGSSTGLTSNPFDVTSNSGPGPVVTDVLVDGTSWSASFLGNLESNSLGNGSGYAIPVGSNAQLTTLPWTNLNQIQIVFNKDVKLQESSLALYGVNTAQYSFSAFNYNSATFTATWTLATPLKADKLLLDLNGHNADGVSAANGSLLNGEWINGTSTYPSGDGTGPGDFLFRMNVLPGDVDANNGVNMGDYLQTQAKLAASTTATGYNSRFDLDGSGAVAANDALAARALVGTILPSADPAPPAQSLLRTVVADVIVADLLRGAQPGTGPIASLSADVTSTLSPIVAASASAAFRGGAVSAPFLGPVAPADVKAANSLSSSPAVSAPAVTAPPSQAVLESRQAALAIDLVLEMNLASELSWLSELNLELVAAASAKPSKKA